MQHTTRNISCALAIATAALALAASTASSAVWYPLGASIYDGSSLFMLGREGGTGWINNIQCKSTVTGKTPGPYPGEVLEATLHVSNCEWSGLSVSASGPTGPIHLRAQKPTWSSYYGPTTGGGSVDIPGGTTYEFKVKLGTLIDCTLVVNKNSSMGNEPEFVLAPNFSSLYPPVWEINRAKVFVDVSGPTASKCAQSASWYIDTFNPETNPHLEIRPF